MMLAAEEAGLAVVVVNYQSHQLLRANLQVLSAELPQAKVVVVDSLSTEEERRAVAALCGSLGWSLVAPDHNPGFGGGMNLGVDRARLLGARHFLLLNPDATMPRSSVEALHAAVIEDPLALCAPVIRTVDGGVWFDGAVVDRWAGRTVATRNYEPSRWGHLSWLTGACLMISEDLWARTGGFDDDYFLYWEDVDLSVRVTRLGGRLLVVPSATAVHDEGLTHRSAEQSARAKSELYYYYNIRNRFLFGASYLGRLEYLRWILLAPWSAWDVLLRGGRRQFLRPIAPLRAALRGTCHGLVVGSRRRRRSEVPGRSAGMPGSQLDQGAR